MSTKIDPPIKVHFYGDQKPTTFITLEGIENWAQQELQFWRRDDKDITIGDGWLQRFYNEQIELPQTIINFVEAGRASATAPGLGGNRDAIEKTLKRYSRDASRGHLLRSSSAEAQFVRARLDSDPGSAVVALIMFQDRADELEMASGNLQSRSTRVMQGIAEFAHYKIGSKFGSTAERKALEKLRSDFEAVGHELRGELEQLSHDTTQLLDDIKNRVGTQQSTFDGVIFDAQAKIQKLITVYTERLKLDAPVMYWATKRRGHLKTAIGFGILFGLGILGAFALLHFNWNELVGLTTPLKEATLGSFVIVVMPAFLSIWLLRIFSRILITNLNLYYDAEERAVMINTFLALMQDSGKVSEEDRILILHSIFRPSGPQGSEDAAPPHWFDALLQRIQK